MFAVLLWRRNVRIWALMFVFTAFGSFFGGTFHGFGGGIWWKLTVYSIGAAVVQQMPITYHNDIYHLIQLIALWLLYRAGTLMTSSTTPLTSQPT